MPTSVPRGRRGTIAGASAAAQSLGSIAPENIVRLGTGVAELDRVLGRPGMRGVLIGAYPNGTLEPEPEDDKVWGRLVDAGMPLVVVITEGVPTHDTAEFFQYAQNAGTTRIIGPNWRCASSQACRRVEPRAAAKAESSTNGTVGRPGSTMPMSPSARLT